MKTNANDFITTNETIETVETTTSKIVKNFVAIKDRICAFVLKNFMATLAFSTVILNVILFCMCIAFHNQPIETGIAIVAVILDIIAVIAGLMVVASDK